MDGEINDLSIANLTKVADLKRTSTYKFFPHPDDIKIALIERYINEVSINKKGYETEMYHLKSLQKCKFILKPINEITPHYLVGYRKERLFKVKTSTYVREMNIIQHIFTWFYMFLYDYRNECVLLM